jgi:hypothetical protein
MRGIGFWIMQYLLAAGTMFLILLGIDLASGKSLGEQVWMSLAFALGAAALFIGSRYSRSRKR